MGERARPDCPLVVAVVALVLVNGDDMTRLAGQLLLVATAGAVGAVVSGGSVILRT